MTPTPTLDNLLNISVSAQGRRLEAGKCLRLRPPGTKTIASSSIFREDAENGNQDLRLAARTCYTCTPPEIFTKLLNPRVKCERLWVICEKGSFSKRTWGRLVKISVGGQVWEILAAVLWGSKTAPN